jgi:CheY-like chemotaxis protein
LKVTSVIAFETINTGRGRRGSENTGFSDRVLGSGKRDAGGNALMALEIVPQERRILAVDDEPDVLETLEEQLRDGWPDCIVEKVRLYETALEKLRTQRYDLVILDIMGVEGFSLLEEAVRRKVPATMLTAHALSPEALTRSYESGARAFVPKEMMADLVPMVEEILRHDLTGGWTCLMDKLKPFFDEQFGAEWEKKTGLPWVSGDRTVV